MQMIIQQTTMYRIIQYMYKMIMHTRYTYKAEVYNSNGVHRLKSKRTAE